MTESRSSMMRHQVEGGGRTMASQGRVSGDEQTRVRGWTAAAAAAGIADKEMRSPDSYEWEGRGCL